MEASISTPFSLSALLTMISEDRLHLAFFLPGGTGPDTVLS